MSALQPNYARFDVEFVSGSGCTLVDSGGVEYLDLLAGIAVCNTGHCHPHVVEAVRDQVGRLIHVPNTWYTESQGLLAKALAERSGFDVRCFFCNSGTEANEAAIKLARLSGKPGRYKLLLHVDDLPTKRCAEQALELNLTTRPPMAN